MFVVFLAVLCLPCHSYWKPTPGMTWQIILDGDIDNPLLDVDVYDIDLFDNDKATITDIKNAGKNVICYFSTQYEEWRSDASDFTDHPEVLGNNLDDWEGERWVDIRSPIIRNIVKKRMELAVEKGCDGVDPDNVDGWAQDTGFDITKEDQLFFNRYLANEGHKLGLAVGLKNDDDQIADLHSCFDFSVVEQCYQYNECGDYCPFIGDCNPVFEIEYQAGNKGTYCPEANDMGISTLIKGLDLQATPYEACSEEYANPDSYYFCNAGNNVTLNCEPKTIVCPSTDIFDNEGGSSHLLLSFFLLMFLMVL